MATGVVASGDEPGATTASRKESDPAVETDGAGEDRRNGLPLTEGERDGSVYGCKCNEEGEKDGSSVDRTGMCRLSTGDMGIGMATAVDIVARTRRASGAHNSRVRTAEM